MDYLPQTTDHLFQGRWQMKLNTAQKNMADMFHYKIDYFRNAEKNQINHRNVISAAILFFIPHYQFYANYFF
jgi:hypothetical protein